MEERIRTYFQAWLNKDVTPVRDIFSEDAVALESKIHTILNDDRVNKVNLRKEFFHVTLDRIQEITGKNPRVFEELFYLYTAYILHKLKK